MLRVLKWVIAAAIVVAVAWWIASLPGTVTVRLAGYTIETATSLALVGVAGLVLLLVLLLRLIGWVRATPRRLAARRARRRREAGDAAVTRTLVALAAGEDGNALRESARARRLLGDTPQTLLLAAEARRLAQREDEATDLYKQLAANKDAALLGLRGLFRQAVNRESWEEAAAIARRAEAVHPGGAWLREERAQLAVRTGNWAQALQLAPPEAPRAAYATAAAEAAIDPAEGLRLAKRAWQDHPGFTPAALAYAKRLRAAGREARVLEVIRDAWRASPQPELAAFALAPIEDKLARVREAGRIAAAAPGHPESHLLLARVSLEAGLTGEARRHLEAARATGLNQRRMWLLQADLEAEEGAETEAGRLAQREALRRAASAEPDPAWRCDACGAEHAAWLPVCPSCQTAGRIRWGTPRLALPAA
jgi:HemY protein